LDPLCQKKDCGRPLSEFPHNDIVTEEYKHSFIAPAEPLVWGENAWRKNTCPGNNYYYNQNPDEYKECSCPCHWGTYYVNVYVVGRAYGGPEEGGWWYDYGTPIAAIPCESYKEAEDFRNYMLKKYPRTWKRSSVLGGEDYEVNIEKSFAREYPEETPHYE
jgi:hypothetical protein